MFHRTAACTVTVGSFGIQEVTQEVKVFYLCLPFYDISPSLTCNHVQQRVSQVYLNAFEPHHQVPEYDEAEVVNIFQVVLLDIHPVLVHKRDCLSRNMSLHLSKYNLVFDKNKMNNNIMCCLECWKVRCSKNSEEQNCGGFRRIRGNITSIKPETSETSIKNKKEWTNSTPNTSSHNTTIYKSEQLIWAE